MYDDLWCPANAQVPDKSGTNSPNQSDGVMGDKFEPRTQQPTPPMRYQAPGRLVVLLICIPMYFEDSDARRELRTVGLAIYPKPRVLKKIRIEP